MSHTTAALGNQFCLVALPWLALQATASSMGLAAVLAIGALPRLLLLPLTGVLCARRSPRSVVAGANAAAAALLAAAAGAQAMKSLHAIPLGVLSLRVGSVAALFQAGYLALIPRTVPAPELPAAHALVRGSAQICSLAGPAPAGLLLAAGGGSLLLGLNAAAFAAAAFLLLLMELLPTSVVPQESRALS